MIKAHCVLAGWLLKQAIRLIIDFYFALKQDNYTQNPSAAKMYIKY